MTLKAIADLLSNGKGTSAYRAVVLLMLGVLFWSGDRYFAEAERRDMLTQNAIAGLAADLNLRVVQIAEGAVRLQEHSRRISDLENGVNGRFAEVQRSLLRIEALLARQASRDDLPVERPR